MHCVASGEDVNQLAKRFEVSRRSVLRYVAQYKERGDLAAKKHPGRHPILTEPDLEWLQESLNAEPGPTLAERCDWLQTSSACALRFRQCTGG